MDGFSLLLALVALASSPEAMATNKPFLARGCELYKPNLYDYLLEERIQKRIERRRRELRTLQRKKKAGDCL